MANETFNTFFGDFEVPTESVENTEIVEDTVEVEDVVVAEEATEEVTKTTEEVLVDEVVVEDGTVETPEELDSIEIFEDIANTLHEEELIFLEDGKEYEPTPKGFKEMLKDNTKAIKAHYENLMANMSTIETEEVGSFGSMDISSEENQRTLLKAYYESTGYDPEEAEEKITEMLELDKGEKEAKVAQKYLSKLEETQIAAQKEAELKAEAEYVDEVKSNIMKLDKLAGYDMTPESKKGFVDFLFKPVKDGKTQAELQNTEENRLKLLYLSYLGVDKGTVDRKAKTEAVRETRKFFSKADPKHNTGLTTRRTVTESKGVPEGSFFDRQITIED